MSEENLSVRGTVTTIDDKALCHKFYYSCKEGLVEVVKAVLLEGASVNWVPTHGCTPLFVAALRGHLEVVKILLEQGALVNNKATSPLCVLSHQGFKEKGKDFANSSSNTADKAYSTPLYAASQNGHVAVVKVLLEGGASVDLVNSRGYSPLYIAAQIGHAEVVKLLLDNGANVDLASSNGFTPLYIASQIGNTDVVCLLLEHKAQVDLANTRGFSPLYVASEKGHMGVVKHLIARGATVDLANVDGFTPLYIAAQAGYVDVMKLLLESGAKVGMANVDGFTPLHIAARRGHVDAVKLLMDKGANIDLATIRGATPLYMASQTGHVEVVKMLLAKRARVDLESLPAAIHNGHTEVVKLLLDKTSVITFSCDAFFNAVHNAARAEHLEVVKLLVEKCVGVNWACDLGYTPFKVAARVGNMEIVKLLLDKVDAKTLREALLISLAADSLTVAKLLIHSHPQFAVKEPIALFYISRSGNSLSNEILKFLMDNSAKLNHVMTTSQQIENFFRGKGQILDGIQQAAALHLAVINKHVSNVWHLTLHGADTSIPFIKDNVTQTVWQLCDDKATREALFHFWTPQTHKLHPKWVREAIFNALLVSKRLNWPFDQLILSKIMSHVAFGWYAPCHAEGMKKKTLKTLGKRLFSFIKR